MKTKLSSSLLYFFIAFLLVSFSDPYSIKRISDDQFRYEFFVTVKKITPKTKKEYYWFKSGAIHNSKGDFGGILLNEVFLKTYHNNQIAEKGKFKNGLKIGIWKTWYSNGTIESIQKWNKGVRAGIYNKYDRNGLIEETGYYKNDKKQGKWFDFVKRDTVNYNNGIPKLKKIKKSKLEKIILKLQEIKGEQNKKTAIQTENDKIKQVKAAEKEYIKTQKLALEKEKENTRVRKKELDSLKKTTKLISKANKKTFDKTKKEGNIKSSAKPKNENLFKRFYKKLFKKKTSN